MEYTTGNQQFNLNQGEFINTCEVHATHIYTATAITTVKEIWKTSFTFTTTIDDQGYKSDIHILNA